VATGHSLPSDSDNDDCKPSSTEPSDDAGLVNDQDAASLVLLDDDDSRAVSVQPGDMGSCTTLWKLEVLQSGSITLLPKDAEGSPVLSIDGTCIEKRRAWIEARDRCMHLLHVFATR
jgi:hypothetical protein